jgi:hypothetical protein
MAQFRYLGEIKHSYVSEYGLTKKVAIPKKDGSKTILENQDGFPTGEALPYDFTDQLSLLFLRADPRFEEI